MSLRKAPESRDEALRRDSRRPRLSDAEIRRLYEPAPSPELRTAATDAVREVFITELCQRLDAIYEAAKELGGAVGEQIRALAGNGTGYSVEDGKDRLDRIQVFVPTPAQHVTITKELADEISRRNEAATVHHAPLGEFSDRKDEPS